MRKSYATLLAVVLALSTLVGCGKADNASPAANGASNASSPNAENANGSEVVKIKYVVPGTEPKDYQKVFQKVNEKLAADGVGVAVEKIFIPWDAWDQKLNLMLSTGDDFDLFHVMQDRTPFSNYYTRGALADISDEIEKYGANLKSIFRRISLAGQPSAGNIISSPPTGLKWRAKASLISAAIFSAKIICRSLKLRLN